MIGKMAQCLRALGFLSEYLISTDNAHTAAHNPWSSVPRYATLFSGLLGQNTYHNHKIVTNIFKAYDI